MTTLQIDVPDEVRHRLEAQAASEGFASIEEYAQAILRLSVEEDFVDDGTERELLRRLDDPRPSVEFDSAFQQQFKDEVQRRRQEGTRT